jgi:hypothetical protein
MKMSKVLSGVLLGLAAFEVVANLKGIVRYIRISTM